MRTKPSCRRSLAFWSAAAIAAVVLGQPAQADDRDDEPRVAKSCLYQNELKSTKVLDDRNILFVTRNGQSYANVLPRQCPSLRRNSLLNYTFESRRICLWS